MLAPFMNMARQPVCNTAYPGERKKKKAHLRVNPIQAASGNGGPRWARKKKVAACTWGDLETEDWRGWRVGLRRVRKGASAYKKGWNMGLSGIKSLESTA